MHKHTHGPEPPAQTEGRLIRRASFYDVLGNIMTLGHIRRLRQGVHVQFTIEDLLKLLQEAGFAEIKLLEDRFLNIGFLRATKPAG